MSEASVNDWDGRPQNPDTDGWHWIRHHDASFIAPIEWRKNSGWVCNNIPMLPSEVQRFVIDCCEYLGPCLTPAEHASLLRERDSTKAVNEGLRAENTYLYVALERTERKVEVARQWDEYHPAYTAGAKAGAYNERQACIQICFEKQKLYADESYAINQPISSFGERFACEQIIEAIMERGGEKPNWRKDEE